MSDTIPVIYLSCNLDEIPSKHDSWMDAEQLIGKADQNRERYQMRMATVRNWTQLLAITDVRDQEHLPGLTFCDTEFAIISGQVLETTIDSLQRVIEFHQMQPVDDGTFSIHCDQAGGLELFLASLMTVIKYAQQHDQAFVFVSPYP